jgi:hypothetical protein
MKFLLAALTFFLFATPALAATNATQIATACSSGASSGSSMSYNITVPAGSQNMKLIVFFSSETGGLTVSATYNGSAMSVGTAAGTAISFQSGYLYLDTSVTGTQTIQLSWTGGATTQMGSCAIMYQDAKAGAPETDVYNGQNVTTVASKNVSVSATTDELVSWLALRNNASTNTHAIGSLQTSRIVGTNLAADAYYGEITDKTATSTGNQSMSYTWVNTSNGQNDEIITVLQYQAPTVASVVKLLFGHVHWW